VALKDKEAERRTRKKETKTKLLQLYGHGGKNAFLESESSWTDERMVMCGKESIKNEGEAVKDRIAAREALSS